MNLPTDTYTYTHARVRARTHAYRDNIYHINRNHFWTTEYIDKYVSVKSTSTLKNRQLHLITVLLALAIILQFPTGFINSSVDLGQKF